MADIQTPAQILIKILHASPHPSKEGFVAVLTPAPLTPLGLGSLKLLKLFTKQKMLSRLKINPGCAGYLS